MAGLTAGRSRPPESEALHMETPQAGRYWAAKAVSQGASGRLYLACGSVVAKFGNCPGLDESQQPELERWSRFG